MDETTPDDMAPSEGSRHDGLIQTLEKLTRPEGQMSPQERGRVFNKLLAESFRLGGLRPSPSRVGRPGAADVAFVVGKTPFVVEATSAAQPIDVEPPAKLASRVRQRPEGTLGIFISMGGYTAPALANLERSGERPRVVLFDGRHVEAIVTGRIPPADLIRAAVKVASLTGRIHVSPDELLTVIKHCGPTFLTSPGDYTLSKPLMRRRASRARIFWGPKALAAGTGLACLVLAVTITNNDTGGTGPRQGNRIILHRNST